MQVLFSDEVVSRTLEILQEAGRKGCECVVLWLGCVHGDQIVVKEAYRPAHEGRRDIFWIGEDGMQELKSRLRSTRTMIAAQVHTHPRRAFHSEADNKWAIIRHEGALSLVVPNFAIQTSPESFLTEAKTYRLDANDEWCEVEQLLIQSYLCRI